MPFNHDQFLADFKKPWQQAVIQIMLKEKKIFTFSLIGTVSRDFEKKVIDVMPFTDFLVEIGFMTRDRWIFELNPDYVPKNQR